MKKLLAILLAVMMIAALTVPALAAEGDATVTITGITSGDSITLYKVYSATVNAKNEIVYTAESWVPEAYQDADVLDGVADDAAAAITAANTLAAAAISGGVTGITKTAAEAAEGFDVAPGYYVAIASGTSATVVYQNMLIDASPVPNEAGDGYVPAEVTAAVKSTENIPFDKVSEAAGEEDAADSLSVGDYDSFTITTAIPSYPSNSTQATFVITDTPVHMAIVNTSDKPITVEVNEEPVEPGENTFTLDLTEAGAMTITFVKDYILAHGGNSVVVTYSAQITDDAATDPNGSASNPASITYNPNPYVNTTNDIEDIVEYDTYGFYFTKVNDKETPEALANATFALFTDEDYEIPATNAEGVALTFTSGEDGYVYFSGLAAGTYYVRETAAPSGYVAVADFSITVNAENATADNPATANVTETNYYAYADADGSNNIVDESGTTLPSTGGIGTTIFYVIGGILVLGAGVVLVTKARVRKEEN